MHFTSDVFFLLSFSDFLLRHFKHCTFQAFLGCVFNFLLSWTLFFCGIHIPSQICHIQCIFLEPQIQHIFTVHWLSYIIDCLYLACWLHDLRIICVQICSIILFLFSFATVKYFNFVPQKLVISLLPRHMISHSWF